jgi:hypothetical protein
MLIVCRSVLAIIVSRMRIWVTWKLRIVIWASIENNRIIFYIIWSKLIKLYLTAFYSLYDIILNLLDFGFSPSPLNLNLMWGDNPHFIFIDLLYFGFLLQIFLSLLFSLFIWLVAYITFSRTCSINCNLIDFVETGSILIVLLHLLLDCLCFFF